MTRHLSRLSDEARETIHRSLSTQAYSEAVPLLKVLKDVRLQLPDLHESDEELSDHIIAVASSQGRAVEFDEGP